MNSKNIWQVHIPKRVAQAVSGFPADDEARLMEVLREFEVNPFSGDITKIKGENNKWRHRVGNYRVFYSVCPLSKLVEVKEIRRRTSSTY